MKITHIEGVLRNHHLKYPKLEVLQPTNTLYTAMLVQPRAEIQVRDGWIRNVDREGARKLFNGIAREAINKNVELLVTPEYSFPWEAFEDLLGAGARPAAGQLWVLGCESLALAELSGLKARFSRWATVIHEALPVQPASASYLDPLVYLFLTESSNDNQEHLVMLVQFKTAPSGDPANIEVTRMARGNEVYLFEHAHEVRLMALICSDAFEFTDALVAEHYENLLLIHLQLNDRPRHETYMRYRRLLYEFDCNAIEVVCLNWAENIQFDLKDGAAPVAKTNISASAWHSKSNKFATEDQYIESNHRLGLYYTQDGEQHRHMLHFAYDAGAFLIETTKVRHHAVPAVQSRRRGPKLLSVLHWSAEAQQWVTAVRPAEDGFTAMTAQYGDLATQLDACHAASPLGVERLACITSGALGPRKDWYSVPALPPLQLQPRTEVVLRVSVARDPDGRVERDRIMRTINALSSVPPADLPLPEHMADLQDGFRFHWNANHPESNVISVEQGKPAALVYAGESPTTDHLRALHARVRATASTPEIADRFCVLYRNGNAMKLFDPATGKRITTGTPVSPGKNFTEPEQ